MNEAADWAIEENMLDGLIESEKDEVIGMILTEYNEEAFIRTLREDGYDEGLAEGERKKAVETARNLLKLGLGTAEQIAQAVCLPVEQVKELACN